MYCVFDVIPLCTPQFCFPTMTCNRFASLSGEELQALLEYRDSSKTYKTKRQTHIFTKTTKTFNLLKKKHSHRHTHSEFACLECQGSWVQSRSYQNRL